MNPEENSPYIDEMGNRIGWCDSCGEEATEFSECCDDGEVVPYDDDPDPWWPTHAG